MNKLLNEDMNENQIPTSPGVFKSEVNDIQ